MIQASRTKRKTNVEIVKVVNEEANLNSQKSQKEKEDTIYRLCFSVGEDRQRSAEEKYLDDMQT